METMENTTETVVVNLDGKFTLSREFLTKSMRSIATSQSLVDFKKSAFGLKRDYKETIIEGLGCHGGQALHTKRSWIVTKKVGKNKIIQIYPHNFTSQSMSNHKRGMHSFKDGFKACTPEAIEEVLLIGNMLLNGKNYRENGVVVPRFHTINEILVDGGKLYILGQ